MRTCQNCYYSHLNKCSLYDEICLSITLNNERYQLPCQKCKSDQFKNYTNIQIDQPKEETDKIAFFHLPGVSNKNMFLSLLTMQQKYPEAFYSNRKIYEIYGAFPGATWNGRTPNFINGATSLQQIESIKNEIENADLSINLTWNNHLITNTDIYDRFCNNITTIFHTGKHSITVASDILFNYLYEKFPNFQYYKSVITTEKDKTFQKKDERYSMYLWNRRLNNNWNELLAVPVSDRANIEFLCNDACTEICNRMTHYNVVNNCLLNRSQDCLTNYCTIDHDFMAFNTRNNKYTINPEDIDTYVNEGFCHFKLCSRNDDSAVLAKKIVPYFAKPEFIDDVFTWVVCNRRD